MTLDQVKDKIRGWIREGDERPQIVGGMAFVVESTELATLREVMKLLEEIDDGDISDSSKLDPEEECTWTA